MKKLESRFNHPRILVVEDYYINQEVIKEMLEIMGCVVDVAENGQEAVDRTNEKKYDLIVMDIQMPIMDGFMATAAIRRCEKANGARTPIVAITANALEGDRELCLEADMDDYISKPVTVERLEEVLMKFLDTANQPSSE